MITCVANIYSPRWGHDDMYTFNFAQDKMMIKAVTSNSDMTCIWHDDSDPEWTGLNLEDVMRDDEIYPPFNFTSLIEVLWIACKRGEITAEQAQIELNALTEWLNGITRTKPTTEFWSKTF